jgi:hypothetical protein
MTHTTKLKKEGTKEYREKQRNQEGTSKREVKGGIYYKKEGIKEANKHTYN